MPDISHVAEWVVPDAPDVTALTWTTDSAPSTYTDRGRLIVHSDENYIIEGCEYIWYERLRTATGGRPPRTTALLLTAAEKARIQRDALEYLGSVLQGMERLPSADPHPILRLYDDQCGGVGPSTVSKAVGGSIVTALTHGTGPVARNQREAAALVERAGYMTRTTALEGYSDIRDNMPSTLLDVLARPRAVFAADRRGTTAIDLQ